MTFGDNRMAAVIVGMAINANIPSVKFKTASMVATEPKIMAAA